MAKEARTVQGSTAGQAVAPAVSVGRIVHYGVEVEHYDDTPRTLEARAAIVTRVDDEQGRVTIEIFQPSGQRTIQVRTPFSETLIAGCWSWPPRV